MICQALRLFVFSRPTLPALLALPFAALAASARLPPPTAFAAFTPPQLVRNGRDWRDYSRALEAAAPARASISLRRTGAPDSFEARVTPASGVGSWSAYWSVTEHGHNSRVKAGENAGETLRHDFVARQYTPVGRYQGSQTLQFAAIAGQAAHPRQINLVVSDPGTGEPLQAVSLQCS